jgi:hypothetical protein
VSGEREEESFRTDGKQVAGKQIQGAQVQELFNFARFSSVEACVSITVNKVCDRVILTHADNSGAADKHKTLSKSGIDHDVVDPSVVAVRWER